jgi:phosphonoacetate hydrolase
VSNEFYRRIDDVFGRLAALGATVALTADHGMNDKSMADGTPNVIYLQDILDAAFGEGDTKVICPITDAFVRHHGALGGFVRVWCRGGKATPEAIIEVASKLPGVADALDRETVCRRFELPLDREGDVAVIGDVGTVIGGSAAEHDLSNLSDARLRSHGAITEARVPFIINTPLNDEYCERANGAALKSHQIFEYAINGVESIQ